MSLWYNAMKDDKKQQDFYTVVSAIVKFIEEADRKTKSSKDPHSEGNGLIENRK